MGNRQFPERLVAVFQDMDHDALRVSENINELAGYAGPYSRKAAYYVLAGTGNIEATQGRYTHWFPKAPEDILKAATPQPVSGKIE